MSSAKKDSGLTQLTEKLILFNHCHNFKVEIFEMTVVDVIFRNGCYAFLKCCPGINNFCLNSCRLKTSTPQTPKRTERAR